jgi:CheY-like chemotaxis protein
LKLFDTTRGEEALNLHNEHNFDLIISDFKLEGMDGVDLCSLISKREQTEQVVTILACHNIKSHLELGEQCGASATVIKPIDPDKLLKAVGSFLDVQLGRRHRVELKVKVLCKDHKLEFFCRSRDISTSGILIETDQHLQLESRLTCQFTLPTSSYVEAEGEVIRSAKEKDGSLHYGITFIDIPTPAQREIFNYVNSITVPDPIFHDIMSSANGAN